MSSYPTQALTLKEGLQIEQLAVTESVAPQQAGPQASLTAAGGVEKQPDPQWAGAQPISADVMPASFAMAEPLNEAELTALLMASPMYKKLEEMKKVLTEGRVKLGHKPAPGMAPQ